MNKDDWDELKGPLLVAALGICWAVAVSFLIYWVFKLAALIGAML